MVETSIQELKMVRSRMMIVYYRWRTSIFNIFDFDFGLELYYFEILFNDLEEWFGGEKLQISYYVYFGSILIEWIL